MKILIVSKVPTHPTTGGNRYWILSQVNLFMSMGHEVHFLYVRENPLFKKYDQYNLYEESRSFWKDRFHLYRIPFYEKIYSRLLSKMRMHFCNYTWKCDDFYPHGLHRVINRLDDKFHFDACIVNYYWLTKAFNKIRISKKALSSHDCFTFKNLAVAPNSAYSLKPNCEAKAMQRSPYIFALQNEEAIYFKKLSPKSKVLTVYGIYDFHELKCIHNKNILLLSGGNEYNVNGAKWFITEIFPLIIEHFPDVNLVIGGSICNELKEYINYSNIQLLGFIDDPADFFKLGDVAINPTYQGTGLKIKTFESMSYGKVLMTHPHSMHGIFNACQAPIFSSDIPEEWVDFLEYLWSNTALIEEYREKNRCYIEEMKEYVVKEYYKFLN